MTTIYALVGWESSDAEDTSFARVRKQARHYFTTEDSARAALADLVLDGTLCTPIVVEAIELRGPDLDDGGGYDEQLALQRRYRAEQLATAMGHATPREVTWSEALHLAQQAAERAPTPDPERECRRRAVERMAEQLVEYWGESALLAAEPRALRDAVEALREYAPAETVAPEPDVPATASVRDELHALAPLPWSADDVLVRDESGLGLFAFDGLGGYGENRRATELLVQLVNGPEVVLVDAAQDERQRAERAVLDAARVYESTGGDGYVELCDAVRALDALNKDANKPGGAA